MKILHVSTGFRLSYPGGITNYVRTLVKSQLQQGITVHVLARPESQKTFLDGIEVKAYVPTKVVPFSLATMEEDQSSLEIVKLIQREQYDIVHFHMALDLPLRFLRGFHLLSVPYLVSLHDYYYICPRIDMVDFADEVCREVDLKKCRACVGRLDQNHFLRRAARKLDFQLPRISSSAAELRLESMKEFLQKACFLHAVSTRTCEIYRNILPDAHFKIEQIGNESADNPPAIKVKAEKIRFSVLGTLSRAKGTEVLELLLKQVRRTDIEFHFYGRTASRRDKRLQGLGLFMHGSYVPQDIPSIMAKTDVGVVLSIWEDAGPQVAMEFINNRIPVLGTRRGGIPDIVSENSGFLFDPDSELECKLAVDWINNIGKADIEAISSRMKPLITPKQHAQRLNEFYEMILGSKAHRKNN